MPRKVRDLIKDLRKAGFEIDRQRGSHRQFKHPAGGGVVPVSGHESDDAFHYQERQVAKAIESRKPKG